MATDEIKDRIDRYFSFYQERATNLQILSPTHPVEAELLALCYLDALSQSGCQHGIVDVISEFSQWKKLPGLVSLGRLYKFVRWLLTLPEPTRENKYLSSYLKKEFWGSDLKEIKEAVKDLKVLHPRHQWKLLVSAPRDFGRRQLSVGNIKKVVTDLMTIHPRHQRRLLITALEEFTRKKLGQAPREKMLFLRAQNIDLPPDDLAREFSEFISRDADSFWFGYVGDYIGNRERFRMLIENKTIDKLRRLLGFFTFSNVFRRDYRNPIVHKTVVPSQGRDWVGQVNEPYYLFPPGTLLNDLQVETVVPPRFFVETFIECLKKYEAFCRRGTRDPIPPLPQI